MEDFGEQKNKVGTVSYKTAKLTYSSKNHHIRGPIVCLRGIEFNFLYNCLAGIITPYYTWGN